MKNRRHQSALGCLGLLLGFLSLYAAYAGDRYLAQGLGIDPMFVALGVFCLLLAALHLAARWWQSR